MKDHEIAQLVNVLTKMMIDTPDAQKRAALSGVLTYRLQRQRITIQAWERQIRETKCLQKGIRRKNKLIKRLRSSNAERRHD